MGSNRATEQYASRLNGDWPLWDSSILRIKEQPLAQATAYLRCWSKNTILVYDSMTSVMYGFLMFFHSSSDHSLQNENVTWRGSCYIRLLGYPLVNQCPRYVFHSIPPIHLKMLFLNPSFDFKLASFLTPWAIKVSAIVGMLHPIWDPSAALRFEGHSHLQAVLLSIDWIFDQMF